MTKRCYYDVLGLQPGVGEGDIKSAIIRYLHNPRREIFFARCDEMIRARSHNGFFL